MGYVDDSLVNLAEFEGVGNGVSASKGTDPGRGLKRLPPALTDQQQPQQAPDSGAADNKDYVWLTSEPLVVPDGSTLAVGTELLPAPSDPRHGTRRL